MWAARRSGRRSVAAATGATGTSAPRTATSPNMRTRRWAAFHVGRPVSPVKPTHVNHPGRSGTGRGRARAGRSASAPRATGRRSSPPRGLGEQLDLDLDRVEREVVERRHPARVGAPRPHAQVAEEPSPGSVSRPANDDRLVPARMAAGRHDRDPGQDLLLARLTQPCLPQVSTSRSSGWSYEARSRGLSPERDLPLWPAGDDRGVREGLRRRRAAGRRRGRSGGG